MENRNTPENDEEKDRVLRLADDIFAGKIDADVDQIVNGGKFTRAQVDEALELGNEKLSLIITFCEDLAQQWNSWVEREQIRG